MKKKSFVLSLLLLGMFFVQNLQAQIEIDTIWKSKINKVFQNLDKNKVPEGILLDYAMEFTDLNVYDGQLRDSAWVNPIVLSDIYKTLIMGMVKPDPVHFESVEQVADRWAQHRLDINAQQKGHIVLAGLYYKYAKIKPNAINENKIDTISNRVSDKYINNIWQNPYDVKKCIAFSPAVNKLKSRQVYVSLPADMLKSNHPEEIQSIDVDFNDGNGFQRVDNDHTAMTDYQDNGIYEWIFRTTLTNGTTLFSTTRVSVQQNNTNGYDETVYIPGPSSNPIAPAFGGADLRIDYADQHNGKLLKPLIVAEGFDPGSVIGPEFDGGTLSFEDFMSSVDYSYSNELRELIGSGEYPNLESEQDFDIIYVDWRNGMADIMDNSETMRNIIRWVNTKKATDGSTEPNVIIGQSMGGLIARYALAYMEKNNENHDTRLFVSHDAPMQGANVPLSALYMSRHLLSLYISTPAGQAIELVGMFVNFANRMNTYYLNNLYQLPTVTTPGQILTLNDTPAAMQMMYYYVDFYGIFTTSIHDSFTGQMNTLGYPQLCRNVAISNGNECGVGQGIASFEKYLDLHDKVDMNWWQSLLFSLAAPFTAVATGDIALAFISAIPGGSTFYFDFDARVNPDQGQTNREIYHGSIYYEKDILWLGPLSISYQITQASADAPNQVLPLSVFTGGKIGVDSDMLPSFAENYVRISEFGFVPVLSSLDISKNSGVITSNDYQIACAGGNLPSPDYNTPFDNFIVDYFPDTNRPHITFSYRNAHWLANELMDTSVHLGSCCPHSEVIINGDNILCDTGIYYIDDIADNYSWSIIDGQNIAHLNPPIHQNQVEVEVNNPNVSGYITLHVRFYNDYCSSSSSSSIIIWVGKPSATLEMTQNQSAVSLNLQYFGNFDPSEQGITSIEWIEVDGSNDSAILTSSNSTSASVLLPETSSWLKGVVRMTNDCGTTEIPFFVTGSGISYNCNDSDTSNDLVIVQTSTNEYKVADVCTGEFKTITQSELLDEYGYKIQDLFPQNEKVDVNDPNQSQNIRIIKIVTDKGVKSKIIVIQ